MPALLHAARTPRGSRFLINGEPTENKLALGSKGALRYEVVARGRMAHSAYPELGESAIEKLLDALDRIRKIELPADELLGRSTLNIGIISGGRAPNVIPDDARAEIFIRVVGDVTDFGTGDQPRPSPMPKLRGAVYSRHSPGHAGWPAGHGSRIHQRHPRFQRSLGPAVFDWSRNNPPGPHE